MKAPLAKSHHFCELCGSVGAANHHIKTLEMEDHYYLCNKCKDARGFDCLEGKSHFEVLLQARLNLNVICNGPETCSITRMPNANSILLHQCSCCSRQVLTDLMLIIPSISSLNSKFKKFMPSNYLSLPQPFEYNYYLCPLCFGQVVLNFVDNLSSDDLPLFISMDKIGFVKDNLYNNFRKVYESAITNRLADEPLYLFYSAEEYKQPSTFLCSIDHITTKDCYLLSRKDVAYPPAVIVNPLPVGKYAHGFFIDLLGIIDKGSLKSLIEFEYSNTLLQIVYHAIKNKNRFLVLDSTGPIYTDFL